MKRLPRVPVWLILLPLVALAVAALFVPVAARGFTNSREAYAAPQPPGAESAANPTPGPQQAHACPQPGPGPRDGKAMHDTAWGGLWFDLANLEVAGGQNCAPHHHGPPPWSHGRGHGGPPPWSHGWNHERHEPFHPFPE